mgnify:CR=1 FL=1
MTQKGTAHTFVIPEAALVSNLRDPSSLRHEQLLGGFDAHGLNGLGRCHTEAIREDTGEVAWAHADQKMTENLSLYPALGIEEIGRGSQNGFDRVFYRKVI